MNVAHEVEVEEERGRLLRAKLERVEQATEGMQLKPDDRRFVQVLALFGGDEIMQASLDAERKQAEVAELKARVAERRRELEVTAGAVERARRDAERLAAPYRDDIARLAAEEATLRDTIAGDPHARALFELAEERRHIAAEESAALGRAIEETELRLLATRERAIVDASALAAFDPAAQPRIELYNEWRRAQLARSVREREGRLERERTALHARVKAEAELIAATSQDRMELEALEARRDDYAAQAVAMREQIAAAEATALATGRLIRGTARELHQLRVAVQIEMSQRIAQRDALGAVHQRVSDAKAQLDAVLVEEEARVGAELEAEFAPQLKAAQRAAAEATQRAEERAEEYLEKAQRTVTDRYAEGFAPLMRDAAATLREAEADAKVAAVELGAKESELAALHSDIAEYKEAISGSIHATPPHRARSRPATAAAPDTEWSTIVAELFAQWDATREDPRVVMQFLYNLFWKEPRLFERAPHAALAIEQVCPVGVSPRAHFAYTTCLCEALQYTYKSAAAQLLQRCAAFSPHILLTSRSRTRSSDLHCAPLLSLIAVHRRRGPSPATAVHRGGVRPLCNDGSCARGGDEPAEGRKEGHAAGDRGARKDGVQDRPQRVWRSREPQRVYLDRGRVITVTLTMARMMCKSTARVWS